MPARQGARDCMAFSPDGKRLVGSAVIAEGPGTFSGSAVFNAETGERIYSIGRTARPGYETAEWFNFSPDSKRLASASRILDAETGRGILNLGGNTSAQVAAFSPDGHRLAVIANNYSNQVMIYDATPLPEKP